MSPNLCHCGNHKSRNAKQCVDCYRNVPTNYSWLVERLSQPFGDECVEWPFGRNGGGYGTCRKRAITHLALESVGQSRPPAPANLACHSCHNPPCFNPNHLRWDTNGGNQDEAYALGRKISEGLPGEENGRVKITEHDVRVMFALKKLGFRPIEIARMFPEVEESRAPKILIGKSWAHLGLAS